MCLPWLGLALEQAISGKSVAEFCGERVMVLLDALTGLRRGELIALKWEDANFEQLALSVTRPIYRQVAGQCNTEASQRPVSLDLWVSEELLAWKRRTLYNQSQGWISGSTRKRGSSFTALSHPERVHPFCCRAGRNHEAHWGHTFRRTFSRLLKANGGDVKVVQELLRRACTKITLDVYAQAVTSDKRKAQSRVAGMLRETVGRRGRILLDPSGPSAISAEVVSD